MKMLLWKEFRQSSRLLIVCGVLLAMPYVVVAAAGIYYNLANDERNYCTPWSEYAFGAAISSLFVCALLSAFLGGNAIAGERSDRSAEFLAYLPIPRGMATACKAIFAIAVLLAMFLVNVPIAAVTANAAGVSHSSSEWGAILVFFATSGFLFGASWLASTILRTPGNAAATALGALTVLCVPILFIEERRGWSADTWETTYIATSVALGLTCFVGGTVYYLRRTSP